MPKTREAGAEKKDHHSTDKLGYRAHDRKAGGGRHGWGVPGEEIDPAPAALDPRDPNYVDPPLPEDEAEKKKKEEGKAPEAK